MNRSSHLKRPIVNHRKILVLIWIGIGLIFQNKTSLAQTTPMTPSKPSPTTGNEILVTGLAEQAKDGAVLITDSITYYIKDKSDWNKEGYLKKKIRVAGIPEVRESKNDLRNEQGEYSAGIEGTIHYLKLLWCEPAE